MPHDDREDPTTDPPPGPRPRMLSHNQEIAREKLIAKLRDATERELVDRHVEEILSLRESQATHALRIDRLERGHTDTLRALSESTETRRKEVEALQEHLHRQDVDGALRAEEQAKAIRKRQRAPLTHWGILVATLITAAGAATAGIIAASKGNAPPPTLTIPALPALPAPTR